MYTKTITDRELPTEISANANSLPTLLWIHNGNMGARSLLILMSWDLEDKSDQFLALQEATVESRWITECVLIALVERWNAN